MGSRTDHKIAAWQEWADIEPASEEEREILEEMQKVAKDLIEVVALEKAGIRGGDGAWYGSDPIRGLVDELKRLDKEHRHRQGVHK